MSILSAQSIFTRLVAAVDPGLFKPATGRIMIHPYDPAAVRSASYDVRLGDRLRVFVGQHADDMEDELFWPDVLDITVDADGQRSWNLAPGRCYLGTTLERIAIPDDLVCRLEGRSTVARHFITLHQQAGFIDPGYCGRPTVEITVMVPTRLRAGDPIGQLVFETLDEATETPYDLLESSRYLDYNDPTPPRRPR